MSVHTKVLLWLRTRRRLVAWYRRRARSYWQVVADRERLLWSVRDLTRQVAQMRAENERLDSDLAQQRQQHTDDLVLLGRRTRALLDVAELCATSRDNGVTTVAVHKVLTAVNGGK